MLPEEIISDENFERLLEELERKTDYQSRIRLTLEVLEDVLPLPIKCEQKNSEESVKLRKKADELVVKEKPRNRALLDAWKLYSNSIALAETASTELAQAYANRSVVFFYLFKMEECVRDIDRALELGYPDHLRPNLLRRKAKCLKRLGKDEAEKVCEEARCLLENISLNDDIKERLESKISKAAKIAEFPKPDNTVKSLPSFVPHKNIPSASEAIDLKYSKDLGRHFIANRDISPGEVLIVEKPYVLYLNLENAYTYCSHCLIRAWDSIPCEYCIYAMYCSEKCKADAWKQYHDIECVIKDYFIAINQNNLAPLSLKMTLLAVRESGSIEKLRKELHEIDSCNDYLMKSYSEDRIYHSDKYKPLYNLLTHEHNRKRHEILSLSLNSAIALSYIFIHTTLFGETDKSISTLYKNDNAMFFGKLFAQNFMKIQLNNHEFSELCSHEFVRSGIVIGTVTSLLNHSCNPNVARCPVFKDNIAHQVIYALHPISKGTPILDDYGCNFMKIPKSKRDEYLNMYYFKCNCSACNENWPLLEDLPSILTVVNHKETRVNVARAIVRSMKWQNCIHDVSINNGYDENSAEILNELTRSIAIVSEATKKPSKDYYELLELFRLAFTRTYVNKFEL